MSRSRNWCFTINNYSPEDIEAVEGLKARYTIYGKEIGESGTPHLQGYICFSNGKTLKSIKKKLPRAHLEMRRGTHEQARDYCKKDGDFIELGEEPMSNAEKGEAGKRVYEEAFELAKKGLIEEIPEPLRTRFYGTYKRIKNEYQQKPPSVSVLNNEWYWGDSGAGKSRKAREENPDAYLKNPNKWWDGYIDQEVVIIDEWSPSHEVLSSHLKQWADHHPFCAEVKGGSICIRPKKIIITSNYSPDDCFTRSEDLEPIKRRFKITHFSNLNNK